MRGQMQMNPQFFKGNQMHSVQISKHCGDGVT